MCVRACERERHYITHIHHVLPDLRLPGGLFDSDDQRQIAAFKYAVDAINSDSSFLSNTRLSSLVEQITPDDSFAASRKGIFVLRIIVAVT